MRCTWLGWAGVSLETESEAGRLLIDPLADPAALYAAVGPAAAGVAYPEVTDPSAGPPAVGALLSHLHRDHADAGALARSLASGAPVLIPAAPAAETGSDLGIAQARRELAAAGLPLVEVTPWERIAVGPFTVTALPAADGTGDPQVSWAVAGDDQRILHCGDTLFHGWWWRAAEYAGPFDAAFLPINGPVLSFPWRRPPSPLPGAMTPMQAVVAARSAGARQAVPIHYAGFDLDPYYRSEPDALALFCAAAAELGVNAAPLGVGDSLDLSARTPAVA